MTRHEIDRRPAASTRLRDRIIDWLGAQGPLLLTVYMCAVVALVALAADAAGRA
ncbi:MAG: hypothetical protein JHC57_16020 [Sphingopyxis sp.]|uniref:hypothetical protein n=1 Tax=Sphingopyxis sp. TaxID=1908224 RepID=UPI001A1CF826|nr:hypothetical protein [Sphingopyxis sp.]MBJ7501263.1 hypothetical protein [Sphingopyxis sp.]